MSKRNYTYNNKDGNAIFSLVKNQCEVCPECLSLNIKDKGSFSKCMDCGKRIIDSTKIDHIHIN